MDKPLHNAFKALEYLRKETGIVDLSTLTVSILFLVAEKENIPMKDIEPVMNLSQSAVSRHIERLSIDLQLVSAKEDPEYRKRKLVALTPQGRKLVAAVEAILMGTSKKAG